MKLRRTFVILLTLLLTCAGGKPPEPWWQVPDDVGSMVVGDMKGEGKDVVVFKRFGKNITIESPSLLIYMLINEPYAGWYRTRSALKNPKYEAIILWFDEPRTGDIANQQIFEGSVDKYTDGVDTETPDHFYWKIEDKYMWMSLDKKTWYRVLIGASNKDDEYFYIRCDPLDIEGYFAPRMSPEYYLERGETP